MLPGGFWAPDTERSSGVTGVLPDGRKGKFSFQAEKGERGGGMGFPTGRALGKWGTSPGVGAE